MLLREGKRCRTNVVHNIQILIHRADILLNDAQDPTLRLNSDIQTRIITVDKERKRRKIYKVRDMTEEIYRL